jgi:hypothetical protein
MSAETGSGVEPALAGHDRDAARKAWMERLTSVVGRAAAATP